MVHWNRRQIRLPMLTYVSPCEVTLFDTTADPFTDVEPRTSYRPPLFKDDELKYLLAASGRMQMLPHEFLKFAVTATIHSLRMSDPEFDAYLSLL